LIKSNLPARICFQVLSRSDSRVVLDEMGADKLLGKGDMLFLPPSTSNLIRAQGTYASDREITRVVEHLECEPNYSQELIELRTGLKEGSGDLHDSLRSRDDLYEQAIEIVVREGRGSVSLLQRALGIGYGRAARLIDFMSEDGIVGPYNGSNAREVLWSPDRWEQMKQGAAS
jgi:S-DNA-T family DNA segregation ATPase FtsK/SpoIIIE